MRHRRFRFRLTAIGIATAAGIVVAVAGAAAITVQASQSTALGKILVSSNGRTLYHDGSEKKNSIKCTGACAKEWPPLLIASGAKPVAKTGATASLLGTVKRPDGKVQVTYRGLALYLFSGDTKAGQVNGQGVGGVWHAIAPSGSIVTKSAKTSSSTAKTSTTKSSSNTSTTTPNTSTGSTGGYAPPSGANTSTDCTNDPDSADCMAAG